MKQFTRLYNVLPLLAMLCLASCASEELNDRLLPAGKSPMTFATAMEGLTQTRATTDNTWAGNEKVAVQVGSEVKQYIPTSGKTATLIGADAANTFYWQTADETKEVSAWYCGDGSTTAEQQYAKQLPTTWTVKTDQSGGDYVKSDLLYAMPQKIEYKDRNKQLTFKHLPAKVVINLTNGKGLTEENIQSATVSILSQAITSGTIDGATGIMKQNVTTGSTAITPNVQAVPESGYQKSVRAIVVPQKIAAKTKFIKVTIGEGTAARDYYYTTETDNDANFECGKQYTYNITVTKGEELVVTDKTTVTWKGGTATSETVAEATAFNVTCPSNGVEGFNIENVTQSGDKYTVNPNQTITISYTATSNLRCYLVQGIAQISTATSGTDGKITHTVSGIRGDLVFSFEKCPEVGDYYYADGSWSSDYKTSGSAACIGIVFKVAEGTGDATSNYGSKLPNGIRGYVVALQDANKNAGAWGIRETNVGGITDEASYVNKYDGYRNTAVVRQLNEYKNTNVSTPTADGQYWAFKVATEYDVFAPANTSGWYLPSIGQLNDIYYLPSRSNLIQTAGGRDFNGGGDKVRYWSSTEQHSADAWYYRFNGDRDGSGAYAKSNDGGNYLTPAYVRAILTF